MAQGGRPETSCGQGSWPVHRTRRSSHNIDRLRSTFSRKRPRREPESSRRPRRCVRRESTSRLPAGSTAHPVICRCTGIVQATRDAIPRASRARDGPVHAKHCCCSLAQSMLSAVRDGEGAETWGGARRARRRLSEGRVGWLCSAACRLGGGRSRRPSPARIWTAIRHVGVRHPSESAWTNDAPGTPVRVGMSGLLDRRTQ